MANDLKDGTDVGQRHADDLFDFEQEAKKGINDISTLSPEEAAARKERILANMPEAQRNRTLQRLETQAANRAGTTTAGNAADEARTRETNGKTGWRTMANNKKSKVKAKGSRLKRRIRHALIGTAITTVIGACVAVFGIIPQKLDILSKQMEQKITQRVEQYAEKRQDKLFWRYLLVYVFANQLGAASCVKAGEPGFTVHSDCFYRENSNKFPKTPQGQMFQLWKERKIEKFVMSDVDMHYAPNGLRPDGTRGPTWVVTFPDGEVPIDPRNPESGMTKAFTTVDVTDSSRRAKTELYNKVLNSLKHETKSTLISRTLFSIHAKNKYGLTRCIFYCDLRDRIDEKKVNIKTAWNGFLAQRVIGSVNARAGLFIGCMFEGSKSCTEDNTEFRQRYQQTIDDLRVKHGDEKIDSVLKLGQEYGKFRTEGGSLSQFIGNKILAFIASKVTSAGATSFINAIPIIGQVIYGAILTVQGLAVILLLYNMYTFINSPQAQYASTAVKAGLYTAAAATMDTATDEARAADGTVFSGAVRAAQSESVTPTDSRFWNAAFVDPVSWGNPNVGALFAKTAYAAAEPNEYPNVCDDEGTKIEGDQVFCPSWRFGYPAPIRELAKDLPGATVGEALANSEVAGEIQAAANQVNEVIQAPFDAVSGFAYENLTPKDIKEWLDKNFAKLAEKLSNYMFGVPVESIEDLTGAKLYDAWWLGKNWIANDLLRGGLETDGKQFGLGARVASDQELVQIEEDYRKQQDEAYSKLSWWDKIFSDEHERTVINQVAMALPSNANEALRAVSPATAYNIGNTIIRGQSAYAADKLAPNAIHGGIPQYVFSAKNLEDVPLRSIEDTAPCPVDRADAEGNMLGLGDPNTKDMGLGRAEITSENICLLDEYVVKISTANFTNEPLDTSVTSSSVTGGNNNGDGTSTGQLIWPIKEDDFAGTTSCYRTPERPDHYGIDMTGKKGEGRTEILAADGGTVLAAGFDPYGSGWYVLLKHPPVNGGKTYYTGYLHMPSKQALKVKEGDKVSKGQQIGLEGNSGNSFGSHLHFTLGIGPRAIGGNGQDINPMIELKKAMPAGSEYAKRNKCS